MPGYAQKTDEIPHEPLVGLLVELERAERWRKGERGRPGHL